MLAWIWLQDGAIDADQRLIAHLDGLIEYLLSLRDRPFNFGFDLWGSGASPDLSR